jgi:hypothetical protein
MLAANLLVRLPRLGDPLTLGWQFRYTQTAYTVRSFMRHGYNPLSVELPIFGPPWHVPLEFPFFQMCAAALGELLRLDVTVTSRLTVTLSFLTGALILHSFVSRSFDRLTADVAVGLYLWTPFGLDWGSQVLIDFMASTLCLGALAILWRGLARCDVPPRLLVAFLLLGALGGLTKVTTAVSWLGVGVPMLLWRFRVSWCMATRTLATSALASAPVVTWTAWSDRVKERSEFTRFLVSSEMRAFNFGTFEQRLDMERWRDPFERFTQSVAGYSVLVVLLVAAALLLSPRRRDVVVLLTIAVSAPLIFFNLYGHDYYPIAVYPAAVIIIAVGVVEVVRRSPLASGHCATACTLLAVMLVALAAISGNGGERINALRKPPALPQAAEIQSVTEDNDLLIVVGDDWSSATLFHSDRRGTMYREVGPRLDPRELGTIYEFVYWHNTEPFENWNRYFPPELRYEWVSEHVLRIFPISD